MSTVKQEYRPVKKRFKGCVSKHQMESLAHALFKFVGKQPKYERGTKGKKNKFLFKLVPSAALPLFSDCACQDFELKKDLLICISMDREWLAAAADALAKKAKAAAAAAIMQIRSSPKREALNFENERKIVTERAFFSFLSSLKEKREKPVMSQ